MDHMLIVIEVFHLGAGDAPGFGGFFAQVIKRHFLPTVMTADVDLRLEGFGAGLDADPLPVVELHPGQSQSHLTVTLGPQGLMQRMAFRIGIEETPALIVVKDYMPGWVDGDTGTGHAGRAIFEPQGASFVLLGLQIGDFLFQLCGKLKVLGEGQ